MQHGLTHMLIGAPGDQGGAIRTDGDRPDRFAVMRLSKYA
jgi:hypothetical protein